MRESWRSLKERKWPNPKSKGCIAAERADWSIALHAAVDRRIQGLFCANFFASRIAARMLEPLALF